MSDPAGTDSLPPPGATLLTGPSGVGKTHRTAEYLRAWVRDRGPDGVVVLDFAPEVWRDGRLFGGRLDRVRPVPGGVWSGVLDAHAPRAAGEDEAEALALARENAANAAALVADAPDPTAVFVNDATIPFQHPDADPSLLTDYCDAAETTVCNAFESDELGTDDAVSRTERRTLDRLTAWADRHRRLDRPARR